MPIDPQRLAQLMQRMQLANPGGQGGPPPSSSFGAPTQGMAMPNAPQQIGGGGMPPQGYPMQSQGMRPPMQRPNGPPIGGPPMAGTGGPTPGLPPRPMMPTGGIPPR